MDEFCLFSHLGFTYTTYITVKSQFLIISIFRLKKKGGGHLENLQNKTRIGLRHTYERVYNNDVFGCIWRIKYHDLITNHSN